MEFSSLKLREIRSSHQRGLKSTTGEMATNKYSLSCTYSRRNQDQDVPGCYQKQIYMTFPCSSRDFTWPGLSGQLLTRYRNLPGTNPSTIWSGLSVAKVKRNGPNIYLMLLKSYYIFTRYTKDSSGAEKKHLSLPLGGLRGGLKKNTSSGGQRYETMYSHMCSR